MPLSLTIITPERKIYFPDLRQAVFPTPQGETGILPGHASCITLTSCGIVRIHHNNLRENAPPVRFAVGNGSLRLEEDHLIMLVKRLCHQNEVDVEGTEKELGALRTRLSTLDPVLDLETFNDCTRAAAFCEACLDLDRETALPTSSRAPS